MLKLKYLQRFFILLFAGFALCNCDEDKQNEGSGLEGWYTDLSKVAKQSDFTEINKAIRSHEVLSSYRYDGQTHEYVASRDLFFYDNGRYKDGDAYFGRLRFAINDVITAIRILDEQTLLLYNPSLYETGARNEEAVYSLYAGDIFGNMTYYGSPSYYTYVKVDNKLIVSNGDIYTVTSSGLIKDGSSALWSKYDPKKTNSSGSEGNKSEENLTGAINGHEYVDLGLSVKWATCNVGASSPSDYGSYFAWGETSPKSEYTEENSVTYEKRFSDISGNLQYDAARANWGGSWRLPTEAECEELNKKCTWTWTTQGGHNGYKVTGPNGNSIFLPAAGLRYGTSLHYVGEDGDYWSSTPDGSNTQDAYYLVFSSGDHYVYWNGRDRGRTVRPVSD